MDVFFTIGGLALSMLTVAVAMWDRRQVKRTLIHVKQVYGIEED